MSTSTLLSPTVQAAPAPGTDAPAARFLIGWAATLLPLLAAMVALGLGWLLLDASTWPAAAAGAIGWALAAAGWLRRRGWLVRAVLAVLGAPAVVLAGPAALGWLSPGGLVLWGPVSTVLAAGLALAAQPLTLAGSTSAERPVDEGYPGRPAAAVARERPTRKQLPWLDGTDTYPED